MLFWYIIGLLVVFGVCMLTGGALLSAAVTTALTGGVIVGYHAAVWVNSR